MKALKTTAFNRVGRVLTAGLLLLSFSSLYGQVDNITLQFDKIIFSDFADTIERTIPVKLYYSDQWTDTLALSVNATNHTFTDLMTRTFRKHGLSFIITYDNKVILSKGYSIKTNFRDEYLDHLKKTVTEKDTLVYHTPSAIEEKSAINDEYRLFKIGRQVQGRTDISSVLSGYVNNSADGNHISGVVVYIEKLKIGVMTNDAGYYSITLPPGQYQLEYRMIGMKTARRNVIIHSSGTLVVVMDESTSELAAVNVTGSRNHVREISAGIVRIDSKMLKQIPMGLGEADIIKSSLLLPGVQTVGEASAGFNVRGGSTDQNLIYLNNAPIFNPSHFFGFFSAFNSDLISDVTLYKSGIPAKYGGRLSSVLEISPAEGNKEKLKINGGISPVTGRIMAEGPLGKSKTTFILGSRATYSDWLLEILDDYRLSQSSAGFYDIQGLVKTEINDNNNLTVTGYLSDDKFNYNNERDFSYGSLAATLKWTHVFSKKLTARYYYIISNYKFRLNSNPDSTLSSTMNYRLNQNILRTEFQYFHSEKHKLEFGFDGVYYSLMPGVMNPVGDYSVVLPKKLEKERAVEPSLYFTDEYVVTPFLSLTAGIRGSLFTSFGPGSELNYQDGLTKSAESIIGTTEYKSGEIIRMYPGLDYRFSARMIIAPRLSVKLGAQRLHQYIHMISNTVSMSPTDVWKLSNRYFRPQTSDQVSVGLYHTFGKKAIEISAETYFKHLKNIHDYKGGASLIMNEHLETDIINGIGRAYGFELMISKPTGSVSGWIGYSYSRTFLKINGQYEAEKINGGNYYPADYDKPHDLKIVINSKLSRRLNVTSNLIYNTGRPITYPVAFYLYNHGSHVYYSNRNEYRIPDYVRLDLSATLNGNLKARKLNHSSLTLTLYNVLGRKNPYSVFFREEEGRIQGYQMTIFGQPILMLSYNFRILGNASDDF